MNLRDSIRCIREIIHETTQALLDQDVIEESMSAWLCWPVLAKKKDAITGEWLAMYTALMGCRHYLIGGEFEVRCDNKALSYLQKYKT